uniref:Trypsin-like protease n=1 Tax=Conidiobolus coronatus TaxID=34488 RepID=Q5K687_9FUNG|nr:trypsin-like protease [Conidiobolus coronatus]
MQFSSLLLLALSAVVAAPATEIQGENDRIVGGRPSGGYSFMVSLQSGGRHFCGGTLVAPNTVVTAAHCVQGVSGGQVTVRLGITRLSQAGGETIRASQIISHPSFNAQRLINDIAVIKLSTPSRAAPANLDTSNIGAQVGTAAINSGWGRLSNGGQSPDQLMEVDLRVASNSRCQSSLGGFNGQASICMQGATATQTPCNGDSGGPLFVGNTLIGAVSYGNACRGDSAFTRINTYINWINQYKN